MRPALVLGMIAAARIAGAEPAMKPEAEAHLQRGAHLYEVQDYDGAIAELQAGYLVDPRAEFLYTIGQAYRMKGDCEKATRSYSEVLRAPDGARLADAARQNIARCKTAPVPQGPVTPLPATPPPSATPALPPPSLPPPAPAPRAPSPPDSPWYRDATADVLVVAGVSLAAGGTAAWLVGRDRAHATENAGDYGQWLASYQAAQHAGTLQAVGVSAMIVGAAVVFGGIVHYRWHGARVEAIATPAGGTARLALEF